MTNSPTETAIETGEVAKHGIRVTVTFSFSEKGPYQGRDGRSTILGVVRKAAMEHFEADEDPTHVFYLSHDRMRQEDSRTLGDVAGCEDAVTFRLVKELIQG
ncbi:MAG: hypothetical protein M3083_00680 [Actinomycetota bacterium]|nr:hypothetical protein [Actinomycetota bacterium]MDQ6945081.1 hypothetical protein [Actinomycetota bacterium]